MPNLIWDYGELTSIVKFLVSLSPNMAIIYSLNHISHLEAFGKGLRWSNVWYPVYSNDSWTVGDFLIEMLFTSFVLFVITLYMERVLPNTYGVAMPWNFPFSKAFWCGAENQPHLPYSSAVRRDDAILEEEPQNLTANIRIRNLTKTFPNGKVAVDNLSFNIFEDQITILLGHNGAGKSTSISMLSGMLNPTSGTATINGYDIRTETRKARGSIGFCGQNNILFDELTVGEHIYFYSKLKGLSSKNAEIEADKYANLLNLEPRKKASALSGGMKRKLSLAIALCGDSKFVLCDEPSSGMDPTARRELWKVLQSVKKSRSILLTTHYMDEADILGDRIAM